VAVIAAPIGSAVAGWIAARRLRLPVGFMFDIAVIGIILGEAIGRIGDIINGEHHAIACGPPGWCVRYTNPATLGQHDLVHLVVAYDLFVDVLILG
ncbi:MAG: prolipoprotein diacylglyceryl transferase family protein, partial [Candidatus Limnocylindria bacterium]